jgi:hypothetical protein
MIYSSSRLEPERTTQIMAKVLSYLWKSRFLGRLLSVCWYLLIAVALSAFIVTDILPLLSNPIKVSYSNIIRYQPHNRIEIQRQSPSSSATNQSQAAKQNHPLVYQPLPQTSILRALLLFYPNDQEGTFAPEFRWFYLSWTEMMAAESALWRTDLIVYASTFASIFQELSCVFDRVRQDDQEAPQCRVFPYVRIKDRKSSHQPSSQHQVIDKARSITLHKSLSTYGYIDSIISAVEYNNSYAMYDFVLRTDMDCFLTKQFALYVPYNNSMLVGHGGYSTKFNNKRLKRIAHDMSWEHAGKGSLGSTWSVVHSIRSCTTELCSSARYGSPSVMHVTANYTVEAMIYLVDNEFTTPEREQKLGVMVGVHCSIRADADDLLFSLAMAGVALRCSVTLRRSSRD